MTGIDGIGGITPTKSHQEHKKSHTGRNMLLAAGAGATLGAGVDYFEQSIKLSKPGQEKVANLIQKLKGEGKTRRAAKAEKIINKLIKAGKPLKWSIFKAGVKNGIGAVLLYIAGHLAWEGAKTLFPSHKPAKEEHH